MLFLKQRRKRGFLKDLLGCTALQGLCCWSAGSLPLCGHCNVRLRFTSRHQIYQISDIRYVRTPRCGLPAATRYPNLCSQVFIVVCKLRGALHCLLPRMRRSSAAMWATGQPSPCSTPPLPLTSWARTTSAPLSWLRCGCST